MLLRSPPVGSSAASDDYKGQTNILAFEGDSTVFWHNGNYSSYLEDFRRRRGREADQPRRIKYRRLER